MKIYTIILSLFLGSSLLFGQKSAPEFDTHHKNITLELLGSHLFMGVSYDMRFQAGRMDGLGWKAGIGGFTGSTTQDQGIFDVDFLTIPLEINYLVGQTRSAFIAGAGIIPMVAQATEIGFGDGDSDIEIDGFGVGAGFLVLGYRFQPLKNGVTFQLNWNPIISQGFQPNWFGLNIGFGFK